MKPSKFYNNAIINTIEKTNSACSTERENAPISYRNSCLTQGSMHDETMSPRETFKSHDSKTKRKKINIRTLDMVIVYLERIINVLKGMQEQLLTKHQREQILIFICHPCWNKRDASVLVSSG